MSLSPKPSPTVCTTPSRDDSQSRERPMTPCRKYKLPKMKYKGDVVRSQRIRVDSSKRQPLVTEVRDVPDEPVFPLVTKKLDQQQLAAAAAAAAGQEKRQVTAAATAAAAPAAARQAAAASSTSASSWPAGGAPPASQLHSLAQHSVSYEGRPVERVVLDVPLPPAVSADSVAVSACGYDVYVRIPQCEELHVRLPLAVAPGGAGASAVVEPVPEASGGSGGGGGVQPQQHGRRLRVCLPYLPLDQLLQQMRDSAPLAFGQLQFANKSFLELE